MIYLWHTLSSLIERKEVNFCQVMDIISQYWQKQ